MTVQTPLRGSTPVLAALVLVLCALAIPSSLAQDDTALQELEYAGGGARQCLTCHAADGPISGAEILDTPHGVRGHPHSPFAADAQQCETCHGPSAAHLGRAPDGSRPPPAVSFSAGETAQLKDSMCTGCHQRETGMHWASSVHQFEDVACTDCHSSHVTPDPVVAVQSQAVVCYECHQRERAELLRRSAHPVHAGLMTCSDCHAPHGSAGPAELVRATLNETCYDCHAETRGPFLWEHAPVREDCTQCHLPHGSNHNDLLAARAPWLCQQCHLAQFHPSVALSGTGVPPRGASTSVLGQNCMNCHDRVHGSNHPSGPGLTR